MSGTRRDEVRIIAEHLRIIAEHLREAHKPAGGVCVLFLESDECAFGIAIPQGSEGIVLPILPSRLRQIADTIERGDMPLETHKPQVPS